jgi:hypothetical protein
MKHLHWIPILALVVGASAFGQDSNAPKAQELNLFGDEFPPRGQQVVRRARGVLGFKTTEEDQYTVMFHNGRQLSGELVTMTKDEVVWKRKDASEPLRIARSEVRRIVLVPVEQLAGTVQMEMGFQQGSSKDAPLLATVKLPGGDWLRGALTSPDGEKFSLALKGGPPIEVPRAQIEWLAFGSRPAPAAGLGTGPMALDGWLSGGTPKVETKDGTMIIRDAQWIGRNLATPSRFEIAFEVPADGEEGLQLWIQPFNPQPNSYSYGTVLFRFGKKAFHWVVYHDSTQTKEEKLPAEAQAEAGPASYRVLYDSPGQRVVMLRNGRKLGEWSLKPKVEQAGNDRMQRLPRGFCLNARESGNNTPLQLRRLSLLPWDGTLPDANTAAPKEDRLAYREDVPPQKQADAKPEKELVVAGKIIPTAPIEGRLEAVTEKELTFAGKTYPLDGPPKVEVFAKFPQGPAPLADGDAMVSFGDQGELSMAELQVIDGKVRGKSVFAPALELPAAALQFISFPAKKPGEAGAGDLLVFKNGDELPGALVAATSGAALRWRLGTGQEIEFQPERVAGVRLMSAAKIAPAGAVELRTGERLRGSVTAFDKDTLRWSHPMLGELAVSRAQLWRLYPNSNQSLVDGSQDPEKWLQEMPNLKRFIHYSRMRPRAGAWLAMDGRFIMRRRDGGNGEQTQGPVYEVGNGLDRYELRVDVGYPGQNPGTLMVTLGTGDDGGGVVLNMSVYEMNVYVNNPKNRGGGANRQLPFRETIDQNTRQLFLRAFVNRTAGTIDFMVNGHYLGRTGQGAERLPGVGKTVAIDTYAYGRSDIVLSQLTIVPWSGEIPRFGQSSPVTVLANGDTAEGVPASLAENLWKLGSELGDLELPADKVQAVEFGGEMQPVSATGRLRLVDGSALLVDRFQWEGGNVTAHHAVFGDLRLRGSDVSELIYNPAPARAPAVQDPKTAKKGPPKAPVFFQ